MDQNVRTAIRYLNTLPVRERVLLVVNLRDHKEISDGIRALMDAQTVSLMSEAQKEMVVRMQAMAEAEPVKEAP